MDTRVSKSRFKAQALEFFRQVERTGKPVVITDRGMPVLQLVPYKDDPEATVRVLRDTVVKYHAPTKPVGDDEWESGGVIALDTHALIWWVSAPSKIPAKARKVLDAAVTAKEPVAVSSITVWEIAMLVERKRLELTIPPDVWIAHVEDLPWLTFVPVDNRIAARAVHLDGFPHRDPADRIIVATSLGLSATLLTADERLRGYAPLKTVWD